MKTYIVYVNGIEAGLIKAANHNAAEKKAIQKYNGVPVGNYDGKHPQVEVVYTEV
jgi:hypothetical protein